MRARHKATRPEWACYQILSAVGDEPAGVVLAGAVEQIMAVAGRIEEQALPLSHLEKVDTHRRLLAANTRLKEA